MRRSIAGGVQCAGEHFLAGAGRPLDHDGHARQSRCDARCARCAASADPLRRAPRASTAISAPRRRRSCMTRGDVDGGDAVRSDASSRCTVSRLAKKRRPSCASRTGCSSLREPRDGSIDLLGANVEDFVDPAPDQLGATRGAEQLHGRLVDCDDRGVLARARSRRRAAGSRTRAAHGSGTRCRAGSDAGTGTSRSAAPTGSPAPSCAPKPARGSRALSVEASSTATSAPAGSRIGEPKHVRPMWLLRKCSSRCTMIGRFSAMQVPMPFVPSLRSLQSAPVMSPDERKVLASVASVFS